MKASQAYTLIVGQLNFYNSMDGFKVSFWTRLINLEYGPLG
jgi:hypothetical protein